MVQSRCGICCQTCSYCDFHGCNGCTNVDQPFYGECDVKSCCEARGHNHCGKCKYFPCETLIAYAYAENGHGDDGRRIEQCRAWCVQEC